MNQRFKIWLPIIGALIMILGIEMGRMINSVDQTIFSGKASSNDFEEVMDYVKAKYVDTVNLDRLQETAIASMLDQLDPHSTFIPASDIKAVNEELHGNFEGIGIEFFVVNDTIMVVNALSGGPAQLAGVMSGDKIITIDDTTYAGTNVQDKDVIGLLRGEKGTKVAIGVQRKGVKKLLQFNLVRDKIPFFSIDASYMIDAQTGYVKINRFSENTFDEFNEALGELKQQGMTKLIIDLRQNGGGLLDVVTEMTDQLLDEPKLIVYTEGRSYKKDEYKTREYGLFESGELAVLIDEGSASASEILAGAVQDWDRGVIVGRRSFGKGLVQEQYGLSDGSALRLTVAKYYTPSGRCIQKPYGDGTASYYDELINRYNHGEFSDADSIQFGDTTKYYTANKRIVYGGGGIAPDVFVPLDTSLQANSILGEILNEGLIQQFAYSYYHNHSSLLDPYSTLNDYRKRFAIEQPVVIEFLQYANKSGIAFKLGENDPALKYIALRIKAFMGREKFGADCFFAVINDEDVVVQKALEAMKQPAYAEVLK